MAHSPKKKWYMSVQEEKEKATVAYSHLMGFFKIRLTRFIKVPEIK